MERWGLTPWDVYPGYVAVGGGGWAAFKAYREYHFLDKMVKESDPAMKKVWAGRSRAPAAVIDAAPKMLDLLRARPRRYGGYAVAWIGFEVCRLAWRKWF
jgi:hypothetical protein